jgi:hypothetical protein
MSSGLLDFFTLEASEYVETLDGLLARAQGATPDLEACVRQARALRGSATMAKVGGIADVANALERTAQALLAGTVGWSDAMRGAFVAAIDDLKILIRGVRTWGEAETGRAAARARELAHFAPASTSAGSAAPNASAFLAAEAAEIARALMAFADNPVGPAGIAPTLQRVRGLRGIALLKDLPPLPEVVDVLDQAAKSFELGGAVTPTLRALFHAAAVVLADGSISLTRGDRPATASEALTAFAAAAAAVGGGAAGADDIVPISTLFPDDGAPGLVSASQSPPTSAAQRFRLEVVSHAEHLRRLIADARVAVDAATRERLARDIGAAALALGKLAASFSEAALAAFFEGQRAQASLLAGTALDALDRACQLLSAPHGKTTADIVNQLHALPALVDIASLAPDGQPSLVARTPAPAPAQVPASPAGAAPSGEALSALLANGLAGLSALDETPLVEPVAMDSDVIVPIEDLVYRGRDALDRAIELRDLLRQAAGAPDAAMLAELFDLLELAATTD